MTCMNNIWSLSSMNDLCHDDAINDDISLFNITEDLKNG